MPACPLFRAVNLDGEAEKKFARQYLSFYGPAILYCGASGGILRIGMWDLYFRPREPTQHAQRSLRRRMKRSVLLNVVGWLEARFHPLDIDSLPSFPPSFRRDGCWVFIMHIFLANALCRTCPNTCPIGGQDTKIRYCRLRLFLLRPLKMMVNTRLCWSVRSNTSRNPIAPR